MTILNTLDHIVDFVVVLVKVRAAKSKLGHDLDCPLLGRLASELHRIRQHIHVIDKAEE